MEFFVYFEDDEDLMFPFRLSRNDANITYNHILNKISDIYQEKKSRSLFDEQYQIYVIDTSIPMKKSDVKHILNFDESIFSHQFEVFDIILSKGASPQSYCCSSYPKIEESTNSRAELEYDEKIKELSDLIIKKQFTKAGELIHIIREKRKNDSTVLYYISLLLLKTGQCKFALSHNTSAMQMFPFDRRIHMLHGKIYRKFRLHNEAVKIFQFILYNWENTPEDISIIHYNIAISLIALGDLEGAGSLLKDKKSHYKSILLHACILAKQGLMFESVTRAAKAIWLSPDPKQFSKYISESIVTKQQAILLYHEIMDTNENPKSIFFLADSFYRAGKPEIAHYFYKVAFKSSPTSPSIALSLIKCMISISCTLTDIIEVFSSYEKTISGFIPSSKPILSYLLVIDSEFTSEKKDFVAFKYDSNESKFTFDQLHIISFLINLVSFLFKAEYFSQCFFIISALTPIIQPFDIVKTIIRNDAILFMAISSVLSSIPFPVKPFKSIYAIGSIDCLSCSYQTINVKGEDYVFNPKYIDSISIDLISSQKNSIQKTLFYKELSSIPQGSTIMLCIGDADCALGLIKMLDRSEFESIESAFSSPTSEFSLRIVEIQKKIQCKILVHPVPLISPKYSKSIAVFNDQLCKSIDRIKPLVQEINYLRIFESILDKENESIKEEYTFNNIFLKPSYVKYIEEYLNNINDEATPLIETPEIKKCE